MSADITHPDVKPSLQQQDQSSTSTPTKNPSTSSTTIPAPSATSTTPSAPPVATTTRPKYVDPYASVANSSSQSKPPQSSLPPPRSALPPNRTSRGVLSESSSSTTSSYPSQYSRDAQSSSSSSTYSSYRNSSSDYRGTRRDDHRSSSSYDRDRGSYGGNDRLRDYDRGSSSSTPYNPLSRERDRDYSSHRHDIDGYKPHPRYHASLGTTHSNSNSESSRGIQLVNSTRQYRRLYVGNLPDIPNMTDNVIRRYFTVCMQKLGFTTPDPVIDVAFTPSKSNFCFVEFRSTLDTEAVFQLMNNITMGESALKLSRPRDFVGVPPDLKDYIVGHPPGEFKGPPQFTGSVPLLRDSGTVSGARGGDHQTPSMSRTNSSGNPLPGAAGAVAYALPPLPPGELTIEQEMEWINGLAKLTLANQVNQFCPLLTPIPLVNEQFIAQHDPNNIISSSSSSSTTPSPISTVLKIPGIVGERNVNDLEWLNMADNFTHYINDELEAIFQSNGKKQFFTEIIIPRPTIINPPKEGGDSNNNIALDEFDTQTSSYTPTNLIAPNGIMLPFTHRIFGPQTPLAQEHLGTVFIVCVSQAVAATLFEILNRALYAKQLLRVQYSTPEIIDQIHKSMSDPSFTAQDGQQEQDNNNNGLSTVMEDEGSAL